MKPKIGINMDVRQEGTSRYSVNKAYVQAVIQAGGLPVLIPPLADKEMKAFTKELAGVLFIGGRDYSS